MSSHGQETELKWDSQMQLHDLGLVDTSLKHTLIVREMDGEEIQYIEKVSLRSVIVTRWEFSCSSFCFFSPLDQGPIFHSLSHIALFDLIGQSSNAFSRGTGALA